MISDYYEPDVGFNVAIQHPTKQSSTSNAHFSSKAVDGLSYTVPTRCTQTNLAVGNWWQVELDAVYLIQEVAITNTIESGTFQIIYLWNICTHLVAVSSNNTHIYGCVVNIFYNIYIYIYIYIY